MKKAVMTGAIFGATAVALGAFGAHGLKNVLSEKGLAIFETAVRYQMYHAIALLLTGLLLSQHASPKWHWASTLFVVGIIVFSGSLYALTFTEAMGWEGYRWLGAITPLGGLSFIIGWILLAWGAVQKPIPPTVS